MEQLADRCFLSPGDWIGRDYCIEEKIGTGAFGDVYKAVDRQGVKVAIKLLRLWEVDPAIRSGLVDRFDMEYETGRISSPYLVHSLGHGLVKGNPYIIMEFCNRGDVQHLYNKGDLDVSVVAVHTLMGLDALHQHGKVHRDLKPENVLLKDSGEYALTDFGISGDRNKRMTEMNIIGKPRQIFGTYAYMPPEQLRPNKDATVLPTTDIFSFGVMIYQLLTGGELPFGKLEDEGDLVPYTKRGKTGDWDRSKLKSRKTQEWIPLIEGCLQPDYQKRLQNCAKALDKVPQRKKLNVSMDSAIYNRNIINGVLLRVMQGEEYGKVYYLDDMLKGNASLLTVGRDDVFVKNDVKITEVNSCYVSRRHCTLELDYNQGCWVIRDGQWMQDPNTGRWTWKLSHNGTYVNSTQVTIDGMPFGPGDIISVGDVKLRAEAY